MVSDVSRTKKLLSSMKKTKTGGDRACRSQPETERREGGRGERGKYGGWHAVQRDDRDHDWDNRMERTASNRTTQIAAIHVIHVR